MKEFQGPLVDVKHFYNISFPDKDTLRAWPSVSYVSEVVPNLSWMVNALRGTSDFCDVGGHSCIGFKINKSHYSILGTLGAALNWITTDRFAALRV